jgi:hypothetical protein
MIGVYEGRLEYIKTSCGAACNKSTYSGNNLFNQYHSRIDALYDCRDARPAPTAKRLK